MRFKKLIPLALGLTSPFQRYPLVAGEKTGDSIVQLIGSGRNGSTLIGTILNQHSQVVTVPEQFYFYISYLRYKLYGVLSWDSLVKKILREAEKPRKTVGWDLRFSDSWGELLALPPSERSFRKIMDHTYTTYAQSIGKRGPIIDKTPLNSQSIRELLAVYPDTKYIFLNRDGRAVVNSYMRGSKEVFQEMNDLDRSARFWNECLAAWDEVKKVIPPERRFEISYEQLVRDTEHTLKDLCSFLGVEFESSMMDHQSRHDNMGVDDMGHHQNLKKPVNLSSLDKWRDQLTAKQIEQIEGIIGDNLTRCGYPLVSN